MLSCGRRRREEGPLCHQRHDSDAFGPLIYRSMAKKSWPSRASTWREFMPFTNYPLHLLSGGRIFDANSFVPLPLAIIASGKCGGVPLPRDPPLRTSVTLPDF